MVNPTQMSMMSTLAGLQRLEAQLHRAMMEAGAPGDAKTEPASPKAEPAVKLEADAQRVAARAKSVINGLDLMA